MSFVAFRVVVGSRTAWPVRPVLRALRDDFSFPSGVLRTRGEPGIGLIRGNLRLRSWFGSTPSGLSSTYPWRSSTVAPASGWRNSPAEPVLGHDRQHDVRRHLWR